MIIYLEKSTLFTKDPDIRFSEHYHLPRGNWSVLWSRYRLLDYSYRELQDLLAIRTGLKIGKKAIKRWIWRAEIYSITLPYLNKGVKSITSNVFGENEIKLIKELAKNIESSVHGDTKSII